MSKKCHYCGGNAELIGKNWDNEDVFRCKKCGKQGRDDRFSDRPTLFHRITASPEVLAETLVYHISGSEYKVIDSAGRIIAYDNEVWASVVLPGAFWTKYEEAYAATVARLNEVCVEQNAVDYTQTRLSKVDNTQKEVGE